MQLGINHKLLMYTGTETPRFPHLEYRLLHEYGTHARILSSAA